MIWLFPYHIPYQPSTNIIPRAKPLGMILVSRLLKLSGWYWCLGLIRDVIRKEPYNILYLHQTESLIWTYNISKAMITLVPEVQTNVINIQTRSQQKSVHLKYNFKGDIAIQNLKGMGYMTIDCYNVSSWSGFSDY